VVDAGNRQEHTVLLLFHTQAHFFNLFQVTFIKERSDEEQYSRNQAEKGQYFHGRLYVISV